MSIDFITEIQNETALYSLQITLGRYGIPFLCRVGYEREGGGSRRIRMRQLSSGRRRAATPSRSGLSRPSTPWSTSVTGRPPGTVCGRRRAWSRVGRCRFSGSSSSNRASRSRSRAVRFGRATQPIDARAVLREARGTHEQLLEAGGMDPLAVYLPRPGLPRIARAIVPASPFDELLSGRRYDVGGPGRNPRSRGRT